MKFKKFLLKIVIFMSNKRVRNLNRHIRKYYKNVKVSESKALKNILDASKYIASFDEYMTLKKFIKNLRNKNE